MASRRPENEELIHKTIDTTMLANGGRLQPEQQDAFIQLVKDNSQLLKLTRFVEMATSRKLVDKIYVGEPVTRGVAQNANTATDSRAVFDQVALNASKLKSDWSVTTETLQENIEGDNFDDVLMNMMSKRISTDLELLAIQGNTGAGSGTPLKNLLSTLNGWDAQTDSAHLLNASGSKISKEIFAAAIRKMPEQYLQDPDLRWLVSRAVATDWAEQVSGRETNAGDSALGGNTMNPFGIPMVVIPNMPSRKSLTVATATPGIVVGANFGPFEIVTGTNDTLKIGVYGEIQEATATYTIPAGVYTVVELIAALRALFTATLNSGLNMYDDGNGRLVIETVKTGTYLIGATGGRVAITDGTANSEIGLTDNTNYDSAAAGSGTVYEGTIIWLTNPKNFLFGMVDDTRVYTEFNKDYDRYETVIYNQVACAVENLEAVVKVTNLRRG